jgi:hypothetical protein
MTDIVLQQDHGWFAAAASTSCPGTGSPLLPIFFVYFISGLAEPTATPSTWWKASRRSWPAT